jgi:protein-S-isoprenylcysteine O-methyltransferase Ste14
MALDASQSLTAVTLVTLFIGLFLVALKLLKGIEIPDWVLPVGLILLTIDFGWRFVQWLRARRRQPVGELDSDGS